MLSLWGKWKAQMWLSKFAYSLPVSSRACYCYCSDSPKLHIFVFNCVCIHCNSIVPFFFWNKAEQVTHLIESHRNVTMNDWTHCRGIKIKLCDDCAIQEASIWPWNVWVCGYIVENQKKYVYIYFVTYGKYLLRRNLLKYPVSIHSIHNDLYRLLILTFTLSTLSALTLPSIFLILLKSLASSSA